MRAIWSGTISFGLINIPVKMYNAVQERALDLDMLRKGDLCPIRYARICRNTGEEVPYKDIVKGYQYRKGDYIVLQDEDFRRANVRKTHSIEIISFIEEDAIDTKFYEKPYYLEPIKEAVKAYALLREALRRSGKAGLARFVLRSREHMAILKAQESVIVLEQLRFESEILKPDALFIPEEEIPQRELDIALKLIDQLSDVFLPERYHDTYTEELKRVIEEKAKGRVPRPVGERPLPTGVADLMAKLRESLEEARKRRPEEVMAGR